jgi:hypothetical protein
MLPWCAGLECASDGGILLLLLLTIALLLQQTDRANGRAHWRCWQEYQAVGGLKSQSRINCNKNSLMAFLIGYSTTNNQQPTPSMILCQLPLPLRLLPSTCFNSHVAIDELRVPNSCRWSRRSVDLHAAQNCIGIGHRSHKHSFVDINLSKHRPCKSRSVVVVVGVVGWHHTFAGRAGNRTCVIVAGDAMAREQRMWTTATSSPLQPSMMVTAMDCGSW